MNARVMVRGAGATLLATALIGGCATMADSGTGSETNWAGYCDESRPCTSGECVCGYCLELCDATDDCSGTGQCVQPGTPAHAEYCDGSVSRGVCSRSCVDLGDCTVGFSQCVDGFCAADSIRPLDQAAQKPWSGACSEDTPCSTGECVCGACVETCEQAGQCREGLHCVPPGHPSHARLCGSANDAPGVCLRLCVDNGICDAGTICHDGLCTPSAEAHPDTAPLGQFCGSGGANLFRNLRTNVYSLENHHGISRTPVCDSGLCLIAHFQGHPLCPYGSADPLCADEDVPPQLVARPPEEAIHCSCLCDGPPELGPFCACPEGLECAAIYGGPERYCITPGFVVDDYQVYLAEDVCDPALGNCDDR